jgi:hypothetical protein
VEVVEVDDSPCVNVAESQVDVQGGHMSCLTEKDLLKYDYVSVGKEGFAPISVKPTTSATWLTRDLV